MFSTYSAAALISGNFTTKVAPAFTPVLDAVTVPPAQLGGPVEVAIGVKDHAADRNRSLRATTREEVNDALPPRARRSRCEFVDCPATVGSIRRRTVKIAKAIKRQRPEWRNPHIVACKVVQDMESPLAASRGRQLEDRAVIVMSPAIRRPIQVAGDIEN